ncbi:MAG: malto-oligosyltrehalose synthase [Nitrospira sp. BO4]|jgi:(1->4)-alpha-D-glucan 1-alpha-D-glucosylmutase|nr:malto-oligosyltrehalose synthase [Nitrospira sp. BO4]
MMPDLPVLATYRLQLNGEFGFRHARSVTSYLNDLGITHCYSSSLLAAVPGSTHGYDIIDPSRLNPELGTEEDFRNWSVDLRALGMGLILDVVPNHMGIAQALNRRWYDVLENGPTSRHARVFDIDWHPLKKELKNKVLLPILPDQYGKVLEREHITLAYDDEHLVVRCGACRLPLAPRTWGKVLAYRLDQWVQEHSQTDHGEAVMELQSILTAIRNLPGIDDTSEPKLEERERETGVIRKRLATLMRDSPVVTAFVGENIRLFNGTRGIPQSFDLLDELLNEQAYRLASWEVASEEINYRRFFDINELAAIRMEEASVFHDSHQMVFQLLRDGIVVGLRIDHVDGLYDPQVYLEQLQSWARREWGHEATHLPLFIVVEKILANDETLSEAWPVEGTTGYEFLNTINGLFINQAHERAFTDLYHRMTGQRQSYAEMAYGAKQLIMRASMASEVNVLGHQLNVISERDRGSRDFTLNSLTNAIREIIASFPVYRTYVREGAQPVSERDRVCIQKAVAHAKRRNPVSGSEVFDFIRELLLKQHDLCVRDSDEVTRFIMKFQQATSPVTAKGIEDTAFYRYNRFLSLNEVGGEPQQFGLSPDHFHRRMTERHARWPKALSATATHDTKRGEDARARLNVLSEIPDQWKAKVNRWAKWNARHRIEVDGEAVPDANDEYLFYQTCMGVWPPGEMTEHEHGDLCRRIEQYMEKATREAKVHTSWVNPNKAYEEGVRRFVQTVLSPGHTNKFLPDFLGFKEQVTRAGFINSLAQTTIKLAAPGTPDFYQGSELWDWNLVDPDNRRPVDYALRGKLLEELHAIRFRNDRAELVRGLMDHANDGRIKLYLILMGLHCRRIHLEVFVHGRYVPLESEGPAANHLVAFVRHHGMKMVMAVVPRLNSMRLAESADSVWGETCIVMPPEWRPQQLQELLSGRSIDSVRKGDRFVVRAADLFAVCPVGLLEGDLPEPSQLGSQ